MNDFELRALYDRLIAGRAPSGRSACVPPELLGRLAAGDAAGDERLSALEHVAQCRDCRRELELLRAVTDAGAGLGVARVRRASPWVLALAASIVMAVGATALWRSGWLDPADVVRGDAPTVTLVAPLRTVDAADARRLVWRAVAGATLYEVEVLDGAGNAVFAAPATDTAVALPAATTLVPGTEYHWRVTAVLAGGARLRSPAQPVRVRGQATP
jgi:hypothetical protein